MNLSNNNVDLLLKNENESPKHRNSLMQPKVQILSTQPMVQKGKKKGNEQQKGYKELSQIKQKKKTGGYSKELYLDYEPNEKARYNYQIEIADEQIIQNQQKYINKLEQQLIQGSLQSQLLEQNQLLEEKVKQQNQAINQIENQYNQNLQEIDQLQLDLKITKQIIHTNVDLINSVFQENLDLDDLYRKDSTKKFSQKILKYNQQIRQKVESNEQIKQKMESNEQIQDSSNQLLLVQNESLKQQIQIYQENFYSLNQDQEQKRNEQVDKLKDKIDQYKEKINYMKLKYKEEILQIKKQSKIEIQMIQQKVKQRLEHYQQIIQEKNDCLERCRTIIEDNWGGLLEKFELVVDQNEEMAEYIERINAQIF